MFFNKKLVSVAVLAGVMVAGSAFAADTAKKGATVTFKAQIRAASCDVTSTTKGSVIDWGVFTLEQTANKAVKDQLGSSEKFDLILNNCSKDPVGKNMNVYASGEQSTLFPEIFANATSQSLGVKLLSGTTVVTPNKETGIVLSDTAKTDAGILIPIEAQLLLTKAGGVAPDTLNVPVTFTVSYN